MFISMFRASVGNYSEPFNKMFFGGRKELGEPQTPFYSVPSLCLRASARAERGGNITQGI